jgi:hypothetical protein
LDTIGAKKVVEVEPSIIIIQNYEVTLTTEDIPYTGPAKPLIASLLIDNELNNCFIAGRNLYPCLADLNKEMQGIPGWIMRITSKRRHAVIKGKTTAVGGSFFVDYIALQPYSSNPGYRTPRKRINILNLELFIDDVPNTKSDQLRMALAIVDLHHRRGIRKIRSSRGATGSALLKASPYWEKKRHAAPKFINDTSRNYLPGNFYSISRNVRKAGTVLSSCYYLDQTSAHHNIAAQEPMPHPHTIRARGYFKRAMEIKSDYYPIWASRDSNVSNSIISGEQVGLFLVRINRPHLPPNEEHIYPPWVKAKKRYVWLWTPDIIFADNDKRLEIEGIVGGFSSYVSDPVISEYAEFSLDYIKNNPTIYTKSILLAAYGMLAFNSSNYKKLYRYWGGKVSGKTVSLPQAGNVTERVIKIPDNLQHSISNVAARGIIEAETRRRTIEYAKQLYSEGHHIAQIYADGILVESHQLPFTPEGWRIAESLTNVSIPRTNAFVSDQLIKLPGIPRTEDDIRWLERRTESRKPLTRVA